RHRDPRHGHVAVRRQAFARGCDFAMDHARPALVYRARAAELSDHRGRRELMRSNDSSAAIAAGVLALPFAIIFALLVLHIEPPLGPLESMLKGEVDRPNVLGSAIVFGAWLLSAVALVFAVRRIVRG